MSHPNDNERQGMNRISERGPAIAAELGLSLKRCAWGQTDADFYADRWSLVLKTEHAREVLKFDADALADPKQWEVLELIVRRELEKMQRA